MLTDWILSLATPGSPKLISVLWSQIIPSHSLAFLDAAYGNAISSQSISRRLECMLQPRDLLPSITPCGPHNSVPSLCLGWTARICLPKARKQMCPGAWMEAFQTTCCLYVMVQRMDSHGAHSHPQKGTMVPQHPHSPQDSCSPYTWCPLKSRAPRSRNTCHAGV